MKTWFITGTSRGFGREWAIAALERGDQVAATARNLATWAQWQQVAAAAQGTQD
jgi:NAD(P)-dependent dehydrogenase (short-subunit alcohol dehydrogenase family)